MNYLLPYDSTFVLKVDIDINRERKTYNFNTGYIYNLILQRLYLDSRNAVFLLFLYFLCAS